MIRIGTISPPGWRSFCGEEMQAMAAQPLNVINLTLPLGEDFAFATVDIIGAECAIQNAAVELAAEGVAAILQIGGPFAFLHGAAAARQIEQRIAQKTGLPFQMMALSMLRALEQCKARQVTICSAYYPDEWNAPLEEFVAYSGAQICGRRSFTEIHAGQPQDTASMAQNFQDFSPTDVIEAVRACAQCNLTDTLYLAGIPCPMLMHCQALHHSASIPVISYLASYVRLFGALGIATRKGFEIP